MKTPKSHKINTDLTQNYANYDAGYFAKKYGISKTAIYTRVSKLRLSHNATWSGQKDSIIKDYQDGKSLDQLGKKYGHYEQNIKKKITEWGINIRTVSESNSIYDFDKSFFKKINSHEKAYWLGFIYADGNVYQKKNTMVFQICLSKRDKLHIVKLKKSLKSEHKIYNDRENIRLMISNDEFARDLIDLGVSPRKSLTLNFPSSDVLSKEFYSSFILGYFDGDGSISVRKNRWQFNLVGTRKFLQKIEGILNDVGISQTKLTKEKRCKIGDLVYLTKAGSICYNKNFKRIRNDNLPILYEYLYSNSLVFLTRKKKNFDEIIGRRKLS